MSLCVAERVVSKPGRASCLKARSILNFARNSPAACSNIEFASLELQRFWGVSKNDHDKLRAKFGRRWCRCCPRALRPGPVDRVARLSETAVAFVGAGRASTETAIAFAGEKWAFLVRFSAALVLLVSTVAIQGRALVTAVSCWPVLVVAEVSLVSKSPRHSVQCAKKFAQQGLVVGVSVTKFAQRSRNSRKSAFYGVLGEFCTGSAQERPVLGEFCTGLARKVASGESYGPIGTRKAAFLAVVVPGATRTEGGRTRTTGVPPQPPPTSRAPAPREPGKPATASCRRKTQTLRPRTTRSG